MRVRAIRGAVTVEANTRESILSATRELVQAVVERNSLSLDDMVSAIFTMTADLDAVFPAEAAREMGWNQVPLLNAREIPVPGSLPRCVRLLLHTYTDLPADGIQHVYLRDAVRLRPDLNTPQ